MELFAQENTTRYQYLITKQVLTAVLNGNDDLAGI